MVPLLTLRAFAEMLELPLYEQIRIMAEQKYPNKGAASFRVPFYHPALSAIRRFYRQGHQIQIIEDAIKMLRDSATTDAKKENNIRVLRAFQTSAQTKRDLTPIATTGMRAGYAGIELKYAPDLMALEQQREKYILYNSRQAPLTESIARATLELAYSLLREKGTQPGIRDVEYIDFSQAGRAYHIQRVRQQTLRHAQATARAIVQIWPSIA